MSTQAPAVSHSNIHREANHASAGAIGLAILRVAGRILAVLLAIVLALPVLLLPVSTAVPGWITIICAIADVALIVLQFGLRPARRGIAVGQKLGQMAEQRGLTPTQLALLWAKDQPGITAPIIGPRTLQHLEDALPLLEMTLDEADRPVFDALVHPGNAVADFHNSNDWMKARIVDEPEAVV